MLNRKVVAEFLDERLKDCGIKMPRNVRKQALVETFCQYVEDDYYEWLKDNFKSFFQGDGKNRVNWKWIRDLVNKTTHV